MKKFLSILMAAMMLLAMTAAFAEEATTYTITINGGDEGHTYEAYQIFAGDLSGDVLSNITLGNGVTNQVMTFDGTTYTEAAKLAEALSSANINEFAALVGANLATVAGTSTYDEETGTYTISGLPAGYYLVKDQDPIADGHAYTKFIVKIVKDTEATPKTDKTSHEKKVQENVKYTENVQSEAGYSYGAGYNDVADYNIGDVVPFSLYSKVPDLTNFTHYELTFHDDMSEGLSLDPNSFKVTIGGTELTNGTDYTVTTATTDGCTFELTITELCGKNYSTGATVRVDFSAELNENAVIGLDGNPNQSKLEFSNNPNDTTATTETPWDYVLVFTYELDVTKVDGADTTKTLAGAEFVLQNADGAYVIVDEDGIVTGWDASIDKASTLTSDANGLFKVIGLDDGTYTLTETKAPDGYNLLADSITIEVKATTANGHSYANVPSDALTALKIKVDSTEAAGDVDTGIVNTAVRNNVGATLPETGGIGTTLFYLFGSIMAAGSALILVVRRRADAEEE